MFCVRLLSIKLNYYVILILVNWSVKKQIKHWILTTTIHHMNIDKVNLEYFCFSFYQNDHGNSFIPISYFMTNYEISSQISGNVGKIRMNDGSLWFDFSIFEFQDIVQLLQDPFITVDTGGIVLHTLLDEKTETIVDFGLNIHNRVIKLQFGTNSLR